MRSSSLSCTTGSFLPSPSSQTKLSSHKWEPERFQEGPSSPWLCPDSSPSLLRQQILREQKTPRKPRRPRLPSYLLRSIDDSRVVPELEGSDRCHGHSSEKRQGYLLLKRHQGYSFPQRPTASQLLLRRQSPEEELPRVHASMRTCIRQLLVRFLACMWV